MNKNVEEKNIRTVRIIAGVLFVIFTAVMFYMQIRFAFILEDTMFSKDPVTGEKLSSIGGIFSTIVPTMKTYGGSILSLAILRIILVLGDVFANVLNMLVLFSVSFLIGKCSGAKKEWIFFTALPFVMMFSLNSEWKNTYLWEFGIVNFLFPAVPFLIYLYLVLLEINGEKKCICTVKAVIACLAAFFAGFANASYGALAIVAGAAGMVIMSRIVGMKPKKWMLISVICSIAGIALYMMASGNYKLGSIMSTEYINFSIFPAVVLALLMLAISLRSGGWVSISEMVLIVTLGVGVVMRFVIQVIPGVYPNGLQVGTILVAITLLCNILNRFIKENKRTYKWALILTVCGFSYIVLNIIADIGGVS